MCVPKCTVFDFTGIVTLQRINKIARNEFYITADPD